MHNITQDPRLLVVDDEKDIGEFVGFVASNAGYSVTCISNPHDFIEAYSDELRVIIMDLTMPGIDGVELIRYLASVDSKAGIILMSGFDVSVLHSAKELADSRGLYILGALEKPISIDNLETILHRLDDVDKTCIKSKKTCNSVTVDELKWAIHNHELVTYYQPKIDMSSRFLVSFEALVRWKHPLKGLIMPDDFIALAEETGLIKDLTYQVLTQALTVCGELKSKGIIVQVAVNVSAKILTDLEFPEQLQKKLIEHKLDPSQLIIEITESKISDDFAHALD
ncbi:MAG: EAL domain-containing protein, partial [Gammaproteobacteria bacterium]